MISSDSRYLGIPGEREREKLFNDFWDIKERKEREEQRQQRRMALDRFRNFVHVQ